MPYLKGFAMVRWILALVVALCLLSPATATLSPRKDLGADSGKYTTLQRTPSIPRTAGKSAAARGQFEVTDQTEVQLDGRTCRYQDVPPTATILRIELAADGRTILKILFRSRR
jgi:hypothetical protein